MGGWKVTCFAVWGRPSHVSLFKLVIMDTVPDIKKKIYVYYEKKKRNWIGLLTANLRVCCALFPLPRYVFCVVKVLVFLYDNERVRRVKNHKERYFKVSEALFLFLSIFFFFLSALFLEQNSEPLFSLIFFFSICY